MSLTSTLNQYKRVFTLLKKPSKDEFKMTAKITLVGLMIVGLFGFVVSLSTKFLFKLI
jgi:protein translocase SEC61 complex gamma subunit